MPTASTTTAGNLLPCPGCCYCFLPAVACCSYLLLMACCCLLEHTALPVNRFHGLGTPPTTSGKCLVRRPISPQRQTSTSCGAAPWSSPQQMSFCPPPVRFEWVTCKHGDGPNWYQPDTPACTCTYLPGHAASQIPPHWYTPFKWSPPTSTALWAYWCWPTPHDS